jgi:hypothetical protein
MNNTHVLVVYSSPVAGQEAEYNQWYDEQHLEDVLKSPGFLSAQRFRLPDAPDKTPCYLALYEMRTEDAEAALAELTSRAGTPHMIISDAIDMTVTSMTLATAITDRVTK